MDIMNTLKSTVNVQKQMMNEMNVDSMYDVMDDLGEFQEDQNEINEAFTRIYKVNVGDEELDAEGGTRRVGLSDESRIRF